MPDLQPYVEQPFASVPVTMMLLVPPGQKLGPGKFWHAAAGAAGVAVGSTEGVPCETHPARSRTDTKSANAANLMQNHP